MGVHLLSPTVPRVRILVAVVLLREPRCHTAERNVQLGETPPLLDREYVPAPCRVLYSSETGFAPDAPDELKRRPLIIDMLPTPEPRVAPPQAFRRPDPPRRERPAVQPREVPQKPKDEQPAIIAAIRKCRSEGKSVKQTAAELGYKLGTIYKWIARSGDKPDREQLTAVPPGKMYGWLEVIGESRRDSKQGRILACWCKCGEIAEAPYKALNNGTRTSCGCKRPQKLAANPERVKMACDLWRAHGLSETARRMECSHTTIYRLLSAGGVSWKVCENTSI